MTGCDELQNETCYRQRGSMKCQRSITFADIIVLLNLAVVRQMSEWAFM